MHCLINYDIGLHFSQHSQPTVFYPCVHVQAAQGKVSGPYSNELIRVVSCCRSRPPKIPTVESQPEVFNFVSSSEKPIKWSEFFYLGMKYRVPTINAVWHPALSLNRSHTVHRLQHCLYHILPSFLIDCASRLIGQRTKLVHIRTFLLAK